MKWEELPLADRAQLMAAAVRNGYTDIRSIKAAYANFQNQRQQTGNRYAEGGDKNSNDIEVVNVLDEHPVWKALENIDFETVADPEFTRDKTGAGSIEYFSAEEPEGITYNNGYHRDHPMPGRDVILYNPDENDEQDIRLDALHIMPKDPTYDALNSLYREAARDGDVAWAAAQRYKEDVAKYGKEALDKAGMTPQRYFENEADGFLRNMFIEGTPEYIKSKRYADKQQLAEWNPHLMPYVDRIHEYLQTGQRPADILPELTVTNQNAYGGNLFKTGGNKGGLQIKTKKSQRPGWSDSYTSMIKHNEGWSPTPYKDGTDISVGYGFYRKGMGGKYVPSDVWTGKRKLTQEEGERILSSITNDLKRQLKGVLGEQLYNTLTPGQLMGYLDTGYQRPASMVAAAKAHKQKGPQAAAALLNVKGFDGRNAARRAAFNDNWDGWDTVSFSKEILPIQNLTWSDYQAKNQSLFQPSLQLTPQEETLLNTPALAVVNPDYPDPKDNTFINPYYEAAKLDSSLDQEPSPIDQYITLTGLMNSAQQDDNSSWFDTLLTYSPKVTPRQREAAGIYRLFNTSGEGGQLYHGLNFAAYGGKVNRFGLGNQMYNIATPSDQTAQVAGLPGIQRKIAIQTDTVKRNARRRAVDPRLKPQQRQQAAELYTNMRTNEMRKAAEENNVPYNPNFAELSLSDEFRREQELFAREMQEQQGAISTPTIIQAPLHTLGTQPGLDAAYTSYAFNPTQYNQSGYLGGVAATGKADRALGIGMLAGTIGAASPSIAPGTTGGNLIGEAAGGMAMGELLNEGSRALTGRDWGENLRYGLEGTADMLGLGYNPESWSPFAQGTYNFLTDMTNPGYYSSRLLKSGINAADNAVRYAANDIANSWRTMRYQLAHPESGSYGIVPENIRFTFNTENPFAVVMDFYKKMQQQEYLDFLRTGKLSDNPYSILKYSDPLSHGYSQTGLDKDVVDHLVHDTLGRRKIAHQKLSEADRAYYGMDTLEHDMDNIANAEDALKNIKVNVYDESIWKNAGIDEFDGMHFPSSWEEPASIAVKRDASTTADDLYAIQRHEGDHEIDGLIELTLEQKKAVRNAYDQDFVGLPERLPEDDALHGYENMDAERTTTNSDARDVLLGHHKGNTDITLQNKIIDKSSDEKIFAAVEKANGYGRRYIQWLREHGKLTPKKAQEFREAMKIVAIGGVTVGTISATGNTTRP